VYLYRVRLETPLVQFLKAAAWENDDLKERLLQLGSWFTVSRVHLGKLCRFDNQHVDIGASIASCLREGTKTGADGGTTTSVTNADYESEGKSGLTTGLNEDYNESLVDTTRGSDHSSDRSDRSEKTETGRQAQESSRKHMAQREATGLPLPKPKCGYILDESILLDGRLKYDTRGGCLDVFSVLYLLFPYRQRSPLPFVFLYRLKLRCGDRLWRPPCISFNHIVSVTTSYSKPSLGAQTWNSRYIKKGGWVHPQHGTREYIKKGGWIHSQQRERVNSNSQCLFPLFNTIGPANVTLSNSLSTPLHSIEQSRDGS